MKFFGTPYLKNRKWAWSRDVIIWQMSKGATTPETWKSSETYKDRAKVM